MIGGKCTEPIFADDRHPLFRTCLRLRQGESEERGVFVWRTRLRLDQRLLTGVAVSRREARHAQGSSFAVSERWLWRGAAVSGWQAS